MDTVDLTVVTHIRNRPPGMLAGLLISLASQTARPEVIVVDYGSTAANREIYRLCCANMGALLIEVKQGTKEFRQGRALNIGIVAATTKWVMATDCDSLLQSDFIEVLLQHLDDRKMILCQRIDLAADGTEIGYAGQEYHGSCIAAARDWFMSVGGFDEFYTNWGGVDIDIVYRAQDDKLTTEWITKLSKLFHQWHEPQTRATIVQNDEHRGANRGRIIRNEGKFGLLHDDRLSDE